MHEPLRKPKEESSSGHPKSLGPSQIQEGISSVQNRRTRKMGVKTNSIDLATGGQ